VEKQAAELSAVLKTRCVIIIIIIIIIIITTMMMMMMMMIIIIIMPSARTLSYGRSFRFFGASSLWSAI